MSYETKINDNIHTLNADQVLELTYTLGLGPEIRVPGEGKVSYTPDAKKIWDTYRVNGRLLGASNLKLNAPSGTTYTVKNTESFDEQYNLYDVIAAAKAEGIPDSKIAEALTNVEVPRDASGKQKLTWDENYVAQYNRNTTDISQRIYNFLNSNGYANPKVITLLNSDGNGYSYAIEYIDANNIVQYEKIDSTDLEDVSDDVFNARISKMLETNATLNNIVNAPAGTVGGKSALAANAQATLDVVDAVRKSLSGNVGTNVNTQRDLTQDDINAITAAMPGTEDLKAWNQGKNVNLFGEGSKFVENLKKSNPELLDRMSLETLQSVAGAVNDAQTAITQRNVKNQTDQTVQNIKRDPTLYEAVVNQLRKDSAAGTIAGQRAANVQGMSAESDANYDKAASELYTSLFGGEKGGVANSNYADVFGNRVSTLDQYITGRLGDADSAAKQEAIDVQNLDTFLTALAEAGVVDAAKYKNAVAEGQIAAKGNSEDIKSKVEGDLRTQIAKADAELNKQTGLFDKTTEYLAGASDGRADVSDTLYALLGGEKAVELSKTAPGSPEFKAALLDALTKPVSGGGYKVVTPHEYEYTSLLDNKQYNDIVSNPYFQQLLSDETIDSYTKAKTIDDLRSSLGLDMLSQDGLTSLYEKYNEEATGSSNKIFNQAQRAYIAAVTAGDVKATEQLTRLATNAGVSKGNLYAASALAQQFKQQSGLNNTGRQLATDFLNQRDINTSNANEAISASGKAWNKYLDGDLNNSNAPSIHGVLNQYKQNAASAGSAYGKFGSSMMQTTQGINDSRVSNNINNFDRLIDLATTYTSANAAGAANNITNQGKKDIYQSYLDAVEQQSKTTLNSGGKK